MISYVTDETGHTYEVNTREEWAHVTPGAPEPEEGESGWGNVGMLLVAIAFIVLFAFFMSRWWDGRGLADLIPAPDVALPDVPEVVPPYSPQAPAIQEAIESLTPQEATPFYEWEVETPAYNPASPQTVPAFQNDTQRQQYEAWVATLPPVPSPVERVVTELVPAPAPQVEQAQAEQAAPAPIIALPTAVPLGAKGPIANGSGQGGYNPRSMPSLPGQTQTTQQAPNTAAITIQESTPFYEWQAPQAAPAPMVVVPVETKSLLPQAAPEPGCLLQPACAAQYAGN